MKKHRLWVKERSIPALIEEICQIDRMLWLVPIIREAQRRCGTGICGYSIADICIEIVGDAPAFEARLCFGDYLEGAE